ncbi:hypothetical protein LWI28_024573 [Acer negundo]|uniref:Uncharacterized protein n=1 Tax=Acer negundo TaxID=4023 RepID=A0AAD5JBC8_ACENE|nr:hypothetical protein LWI28_024573 [Acer negundo]
MAWHGVLGNSSAEVGSVDQGGRRKTMTDSGDIETHLEVLATQMMENATRLQNLEKENEAVRAKNLELQGKLDLISNNVQSASDLVPIDNR